jgi:hypothetical protein
MGLSIRKACISSDGGWFLDEFTVDRITDPKKLQAIKCVPKLRLIYRSFA